MKLVASLIVAEVEVDRYLLPCVEHLLEFCDEVILVTDHWEHNSRPGRLTNRWGSKPPVTVIANPAPPFFEHEGLARQALLDLTLATGATHILQIDADEFVTDGQAVRAACQDNADVWTLCMQEVWNTNPDQLSIRQDGGWEEHDVHALWKPHPAHHYTFPNRALACGRIPQEALHRPSACVGTSILHLGWANKTERSQRHQRYADHDGGQYHASAHLDSILYPDDRVTLTSRPWPLWTNRRIQAIHDRAEKETLP